MLKIAQNYLIVGNFSKKNKRGGSNNHVGGIISQKLINVEVIIRHVVGKIFSKRIRKTPCLLESSEYILHFYFTAHIDLNF